MYNTKVDFASGTEEYTAWLQSVMVQQASAGWRDAGNLASLAGSFVSGGLSGVNLRDGNGIKLSGKVFNVEGISAMNSLAGGLASTVVNFGMTGNATFNLASIKGVGLLEVTIGKDGISSRLGSGGMSLSSETLMLAASGRQEAGKVMDWKYGTDESRSTLNGINQLGYTNIQVNHDLANDIWNEQIGVDYADIAGYGLYKVGEKSITLNSDLLGGGLEESAKLATVLSHEGTHLYGNRIEGIAHFHGATTYMQLLDQFKLAGDETFAGEIMAGLTDPSSWVENTGDEDWWKLNLKGEIEWDGSRDLNVEYRDEYGNVRIKYGHIKDDTGSFSQSLAKYIGISRAQEILRLNLNDASSYDLQTLVDVLKIHPMMANTLQKVEELPNIVTDTQREKLVGEALMKKYGMVWDMEKGVWTGEMNPIKLTDNSVIGQVVINKNADGSISRFGIFGVVERNVLSYDSTRKQGDGSPDYQGLDVLRLYKTDLVGNVIDSNISFGWQTVANGYSDVRHEIKTSVASEVYRDETVSAGDFFNMRFGNFKNHQTFGGNYFIINSGTTLAGMKINSAGNTSEVWDRVLGHSNFLNEKGRPDNGGLISAACFINTMDTLNSVNDWVMKDIAYPYEIKSIVNEIDWSRRR